jgi:predicted transcriptional regulator
MKPPRISVKLDKDLLGGLRRIADVTGASISWLLDKAVRDMLKRGKP